MITVCFNAEKYIEQTIRSVLTQKNCDIEYVIIDGASTDKTISIIECYKEKVTKWVSEPDDGIASAMNKGVSLSTGDYLLFLHADDYFVDENALSRAVRCMTEGRDIYAFDIYFQTDAEQIRRSTKPFGVRTYFKTPVMHQGAFCKRTLFHSLNGFDERFKIAMDYDFFFRAYKSHASMEIHSQVLSVMRDTGVSSMTDWPSLKRRFSEERCVHNKNCSSTPMSHIYDLYWMLYLPFRYVTYNLKLGKKWLLL